MNGNSTVATGSKISPAGGGVAGTLMFNNNLVMSSGINLVLDVSTSYGSGSDLVSVGGTLTAGGTVSLQALSGAANLDTTADYVLATAGSISGSFASTPTWIGTAPANAANFSIVTTNSQVLLHFNATVPNIIASVVTGGNLTLSWRRITRVGCCNRKRTVLLLAFARIGTPFPVRRRPIRLRCQ